MRLNHRPANPPAPGEHPPPLIAWLAAGIRHQAWNILGRGMGAPLPGIAAGYWIGHGR